MRALTFSEFFGMTISDKYEYCKCLGFYAKDNMNYDGDCQCNDWYYAKIQQPFKPELIVELFKEWDRENYEHCNIFSFEGIEIDFVTANILSSTHYYINAKHSYCMPIPKLTEDFIHNCRQAGIDLEWKI